MNGEFVGEVDWRQCWRLPDDGSVDVGICDHNTDSEVGQGHLEQFTHTHIRVISSSHVISPLTKEWLCDGMCLMWHRFGLDWIALTLSNLHCKLFSGAKLSLIFNSKLRTYFCMLSLDGTGQSSPELQRVGPTNLDTRGFLI